MNLLLSVSLWLALLVLVCCENSEDEDSDYYDDTEFNLTDFNLTDFDYNLTDFDYNLTDFDFNLTDFDYNLTDYTDFSTSDFVHTSSKEDESNFRNEASGIGQLKPVILLGLAVLQIWD